MRNICTERVLLVAVGVFVLLLVGSLILAFVGFPLIIKTDVQQFVQLKHDTDQWERFVDPPTPTMFSVFLFQISNPDEVLIGEKPILEETGPFVYRVTKHKTILSEYKYKDTVRYQQTQIMEFDQDASNNRSEDDIVQIINPALLNMAQSINDDDLLYQLNYCLKLRGLFRRVEYNHLFINITVREIFFDGLDYAMANSPCNGLTYDIRLFGNHQRHSKLILDEKNNELGLRFSYFGYMNNSNDGAYEVNRGIDDMDSLGKIVTWESSNMLNIWGQENSTNNDTCAQIRGTDGTLMPADMTESPLELFSSDMCRTLELPYKTTNTMGDIDGNQYETDKTILKNENDPEADCYCTKQTIDRFEESSCYLDGVIDMKPCLRESLLFSWPHFLWAEDYYLDGFETLKPDENKHKSFILVEPNTGTLLQSTKRLQQNVVLRASPHVTALLNVSNTVLPLLWTEEEFMQSPEVMDQLNEKYFKQLKIRDGVRYGLIAVTAAGLFIVAPLWIRKRFF